MLPFHDAAHAADKMSASVDILADHGEPHLVVADCAELRLHRQPRHRALGVRIRQPDRRLAIVSRHGRDERSAIQNDGGQHPQLASAASARQSLTFSRSCGDPSTASVDGP